jgi:hypothetical protein
MAYVIKDGACQEACPVECIYEGGRMMYTQPDDRIAARNAFTMPTIISGKSSRRPRRGRAPGAGTGRQCERAHDIFDPYLPLARCEQRPGPRRAVRKYILAKRGAIASPALRKRRHAFAGRHR